MVGLAGGGFVAVWDQWPPDAWPLPDRHFEEVFGQYFFEDGRKVGGNFLVNQSYVGTRNGRRSPRWRPAGSSWPMRAKASTATTTRIGGRVFSGVTIATLTGSAAADQLQGGARAASASWASTATTSWSGMAATIS